MTKETAKKTTARKTTARKTAPKKTAAAKADDTAKAAAPEDARQKQLEQLRGQINGVFATNMVFFLQNVKHEDLAKMSIQHGSAMQIFQAIMQLDPPQQQQPAQDN